MTLKNFSTRKHLQAQTQEDHARAEQLHWSENGFENRSSYDTYLACLITAHATLGVCAARQRADLHELHHHRSMIAAALSDIGAAAPLLRALRVSDDSEAWGVSYALLGSSLGARSVLAKMSSNPQTDHWPRRYLTLASDFVQSGSVRRFFDALDSAQVDHMRAVTGARRVFDLIASPELSDAPTIAQSHA